MSGEQVAHLAVALKGLRENESKSLEELAAEAYQFLLYCEDLVQNEERQLSDNRIARARPISDQEAGLILMPKEKDSTRRLERLKEFRDYFKKPNQLLNADDSRRMQLLPWPKSFCDSDAMKGLFAAFEAIKRFEAQSAAKKS